MKTPLPAPSPISLVDLQARQNFIITSNTDEPHGPLKEELLRNLVLSIKRLVPNSFVLLGSNSTVEALVQHAADYVLLDNNAPGAFHGTREFVKIGQALESLERTGEFWCFELCAYSDDFIINESNVLAFSDWQPKTREDSLVELYD